MAAPEFLREQSERCFRLARAINDEDVITMLLKLGREYEDRARSIETTSFAGEQMKFQTEISSDSGTVLGLR